MPPVAQERISMYEATLFSQDMMTVARTEYKCMSLEAHSDHNPTQLDDNNKNNNNNSKLSCL